MQYREKVIKGLEVCLKNIDQQDCPNDCPYLSDCSKYENRVIFQPLMRDALALLKEQEFATEFILDDIPLPKKCLLCPFVYYILTGEYEGRVMCQAMESRGIRLPGSLIDEHESTRPANCPIKR